MKYRVTVAIIIVGLCIGGFLFLNDTPEQVDDNIIENIDSLFNNERTVRIDDGAGNDITDSFIEQARPLYEDKEYPKIMELLEEKGYGFTRIYSIYGEPVEIR